MEETLKEEQLYTEEDYEQAFFGEQEADSESGSEEEEVSTEEVEEPVEKPQETEEPTNDEDSQEESEQPSIELKPLKWRGQEIPVETIDELYELAQKGFDYTYKTQVLSEHKNKIKKLEEYGITEQDIELIAKAKHGDKNALAMLAKEANIDPIDLVDIEEPKVEFEQKQTNDIVAPEVQEIIESISENQELIGKMAEAEKMLPEPVVMAMARDPQVLVAVVEEVESGRFFQKMPEVLKEIGKMPAYKQKIVMSDMNAFVDLYMRASGSIQEETVKEEPPAPKVNPEKVKPQNSSVPDRRKQVLDDYDDIWNMSEEEFRKRIAKVKQKV